MILKTVFKHPNMDNKNHSLTDDMDIHPKLYYQNLPLLDDVQCTCNKHQMDDHKHPIMDD